MAEDILHRVRCRFLNPQMEFTPEIYNEALILIEDMCLMIASKALAQLGMTSPNRDMHDIYNQELQRERQYDREALNTFVQANIPKLNVDQKIAYDTIIQLAENGRGGFYFLDAPGGTGKTFLISIILARIRSQNKMALAIASSGIAAILLDGGRTAHSALKLPLNIQFEDTPTCNISRNSAMGKVLQQVVLIVWDECTMAHKKSLEALDRTMKDLRGNQQLFGGALILLAGDFRQTLPVIPKSTPADELNACLKSSHLWRFVKRLQLKINFRVVLQNDPSAVEFSSQLLKIGNGEIRVDGLGLITLPMNFCTIKESQDALIQSVFPNKERQYKNHEWLSERAILAPKNKDVNELNIIIIFI